MSDSRSAVKSENVETVVWRTLRWSYNEEPTPTQVLANGVRYGGVQPQGVHRVPALLRVQTVKHLGFITTI